MDCIVALKRVDAKEYCALALSRKTLIRADDDANGDRGLYDPHESVRYIISEDQLLRDSGYIDNRRTTLTSESF